MLIFNFTKLRHYVRVENIRVIGVLIEVLGELVLTAVQISR